MIPKSRFQMILLKNIKLSSRSHAPRLKPMVWVKKIGRKTRKPISGAGLMVRTMQPMAVLGFFQAMVILERSVAMGFSPGLASGRDPMRDRISITWRGPHRSDNAPEHQAESAATKP